jgi:predicted amidophosphoribosyltransferase
VIGELITPRPGPGVCPECFNFTREPTGRCRACRASESHLSAMVAISYAPAGSPLHRGLADYKRAAEPAVPYLVDGLAVVLSRFLAGHEACVAAAAGVDRFDSVVVVPSSNPHRAHGHPLGQIVGHRVPETASRYRESLAPSGAVCVAHSFDDRRFAVTEPVDGRTVLLIDDVWTTGACAQSAAAALRRAGAQLVAVVVIGRYVNGHWGGIGERLSRMSHTAERGACGLCWPGKAAGPTLKPDGDPFRGSPSDGLLTGPRHRPG